MRSWHGLGRQQSLRPARTLPLRQLLGRPDCEWLADRNAEFAGDGHRRKAKVGLGDLRQMVNAGAKSLSDSGRFR